MDFVSSAESGSLFPDLEELTTVAPGAVIEKSTASASNRHPSVSTKKPLIQIKVPTSQGDDFIKYITGKLNKQSGKPVVQLFQNGDAPVAVQNGGNVAKRERHDSTSSDLFRPFDAPCMSKNAIAARENRVKKKIYVDGLENSVKQLSGENKELVKQVEGLNKTVESLNAEVKYLKAVIANQGTLSALLSNIHKTKGVSVTSSFPAPSAATTTTRSSKRLCSKRAGKDSNDQTASLSSKRLRSQAEQHKENIDIDSERLDHNVSDETDSEDHSYAHQPGSTDATICDIADAGGVCLHVSGKSVSLEFCSTCSRSASASST